MYYYLYDTFLADKKYEKTIDRIKTRLLDLEIQGKHERLTLLKSIDELINDEVKKGISTVIAVGNDKTFLKLVDVAAKNGVTLGLIPIGEQNSLAKCFGVPMEDAACEVIAARKIVKFDLGKINNLYFFSNLKINKNLERLTIEKDNYKIVPRPECAEAAVYNFYFEAGEERIERTLKKSTAQDQKLELVIKTKDRKRHWYSIRRDGRPRVDSVIQGASFAIKSFEYLPVLLDDFKIIKTPVVVKVEPLKLNVIVGKNRLKTIR
ncbi:hypothetical protein HZB94_00195 [Candidatus Falkowbacteria bacterium]|nr:hypothetical protein [Candidatus Falkowbacteria bacterium]